MGLPLHYHELHQLPDDLRHEQNPAGLFTDTAAAVLTVYGKVQSFVFMPIFGLNNGMVPIIAYNYGARRKDRLMKTVKLSMVHAVAIMAVGLIIMQLIPDKILLIFNASDDMCCVSAYPPCGSSASVSHWRGTTSSPPPPSRPWAGAFRACWCPLSASWWSWAARRLAPLQSWARDPWSGGPTGLVELSSLLLCTLFFLGAYRTIIKPMDHPGLKEAELNNSENATDEAASRPGGRRLRFAGAAGCLPAEPGKTACQAGKNAV